MARGRPWLWWSYERGRNSVIILIARNGDDSRGDPPSAANNKEDSFILSQLSPLSDKCKEMSIRLWCLRLRVIGRGWAGLCSGIKGDRAIKADTFAASAFHLTDL